MIRLRPLVGSLASRWDLPSRGFQRGFAVRSAADQCSQSSHGGWKTCWASHSGRG